MACDTLTQLPDGALLMYLDGETDATTTRHIDQCVDCTASARQLHQTTSALLGSLFRSACPPSLQLGDYAIGLLSAHETALIETHLADCPHCSTELRQLDAFMAQPDLVAEPPRLEPNGSRVRVLIARLASGLNSLGQPATAGLAFAALRGSSDGPLTYEAGDYRAVIEIDGDLDRPDRWALTGLLIGPAAAGASVVLWRGGQRMATTAVDAYGNFELLRLEPGDYELILTGSDVEIHIQSLAVS